MPLRENRASKIHWALHISGINAQQKLILVALAHMADEQDAFDVDLESLRSVVPLDTVIIRRILQDMAKQGILEYARMVGSKVSITFNQNPSVEPSPVLAGMADSRSGEPALHRFALSATWEPASIGMLAMFLRNKHIKPQEVAPQIYGKALERLRQRYVGNADEKRTERQWVELYSRVVLETLVEAQGERWACAKQTKD